MENTKEGWEEMQAGIKVVADVLRKIWELNRSEMEAFCLCLRRVGVAIRRLEAHHKVPNILKGNEKEDTSAIGINS